MTTPGDIDGLAARVLDAIEADGEAPASWLREKRLEVGKRDRLEVLRWVCLSLDPANAALAARALGLDVEDLRAAGRVLQKV